jgi:hypothetical protein
MTAPMRVARTLSGLVATGALLVLVSLASGATPKPSIHNFLPRSGSSGTVLTITGKHFTRVKTVTIGGARAAFSVKSATRLLATVPKSGRSGKVSISTSSGVATSTGPFTFIAYAPDGSGSLSTVVTSVAPSSTGDAVTFTYTAAAGGMANGALTIAVPSGWSAPVATAAPGCTTSSLGKVSTSGQTITISGLTLSAAATDTITYGAVSGGACVAGDGATASASAGSATWQAQQRSTAGGALTNLAASPSIAVMAANGLGTLTTAAT